MPAKYVAIAQPSDVCVGLVTLRSTASYAVVSESMSPSLRLAAIDDDGSGRACESFTAAGS
ncbi:MAG: hypothetical protein M3680_09600 [Myxococcota bacterium]|nr:hypothetical protein [Myxococcota bacterium]